MSVEWSESEIEALKESALGPQSVVVDGTSVTNRSAADTLRLIEYGDPDAAKKKKLRFAKLVPPGTV